MFTFEVNRDQIKAELRNSWQAAQILLSDTLELLTLLRVHGGFGGFDVARSPCFYFNEAKHISVPADQINVTAPSRRPIIARHHHVVEFAQVEVGCLFASSPGLQMNGKLVRLGVETEEAHNAIETADSDFDDPSRHKDTAGGNRVD